MGKLAKAWATYEHRVLPGNCSDNQRIETRRAFYAGAAALLDLMISGMSDDEHCTPEDEDHLNGLKDECDQFLAEVIAGRA